MGYEAEIRRAIAETKTGLKDDEIFFSSEYYFRFLKQYVTTALGNKAPGRTVDLDCFAKRETEQTAWTEGHTVHINTRGPLIRDLSTRTLQHYSIIGHIVHECLHILLTDFAAMKGCINGILKASWYETLENTNAEAVLKDLQEKPMKRKLCASICKELMNIHEDGFIENYGYAMFPGVFAAGIHVMDGQLFEKAAPVEDMLQRVKEGQMPFLSMVMNCMLLDAMHFPEKSTGEPLADQETEELYEKLQSVLRECRPFTESLRWEKNGKKRVKLILEVLCVLYPMIPEVPEMPDASNAPDFSDSSEGSAEENGNGSEEQQEMQNQGGQTSGNTGAKGQEKSGNGESGSPVQGGSSAGRMSSETALEELLNSISSAMNQAMSAAPEGEGTPSGSKTLEQSAMEEARADAARNALNEETGARELNAAMNEMIQADAEREAEDMHERVLRQEAEEIRMKALRERGMNTAKWRYEVRRKPEPEESDIQKYLADHDEVREWSEPAIRMLKRVLKEREAAGAEKGYTTGRFSAQSYARNACIGAGNCFTRTRLPIGKPKCAFALCIDESGSMYAGGKIEAARKTAILLNEILSAMQVPHMVYGHNDSQGICTLDVYHNFDEPDRKDRYRLGGVSCINRNRDGAAIAYGCEKLLKRPETRKIMIVISDGLPTENSFHPEMSDEEDAAAVAKEYAKRKVSIFGAVIDGDVERIRNIYGKHTLDLTDLSRLPQELGGLISRVLKSNSLR